jgi:low molecular weight protein-tyrosine phosphatase
VLSAPVRVCFVCSGNICRSPTAEVVLKSLARDAGLEHLVAVDSAGTGDWHAGDDMDARSRATMVDAGYAVASHEAKQFTAAAFATRDLVVALDSGHRRALSWLADEADDPAAARAKIVLLRDFDPELAPGEDPDVADPYYGGPDGFTDVLTQVRRSCAGLLAAIEEAVATGADLAQQTERPPR